MSGIISTPSEHTLLRRGLRSIVSTIRVSKSLLQVAFSKYKIAASLSAVKNGVVDDPEKFVTSCFFKMGGWGVGGGAEKILMSGKESN